MKKAKKNKKKNVVASGNHSDSKSNKAQVSERQEAMKPAERDYEKTFLKKSTTNARDGKTAYIRPEFHERLTRITQVIGEDKISIYAYLDNLLSHHFEEYAQQIIQSYNEKHKPIF